MSLEGAAFGVGREIVKHVVRAVLDVRREQDDRGKDLVGLIAVAVPDKLRRRELAKQCDTIVGQAARRLEPLYRYEFAALAHHEKAAALDAVADTLAAADLDDRALFDADADPAKLTRAIRRQAAHVERGAGLSEPATELYRAVLDESCLTIARLVQQLPGFGPRASAELLDRTTGLADRLDRVLELLPRTSLDAPRGTEHDAEFTRRYLRLIGTKLDKLQLYGVHAHHQAPPTKVSVAYLNLTVGGERRLDRRRSRHDDVWHTGRRDAEEASGVRAESAIAEQRRILVRGDAGSGKTTLLQWLAVRCAREDFEGKLTEWNGRVPFFVQLRYYADRRGPSSSSRTTRAL